MSQVVHETDYVQFQQMFLTQDLKWGLLHCRQILYQLSYEGNPLFCKLIEKLKS